ncbi:hypothetical protein NBRC110019_20150 [Neptunitalea chrysea]|uniref:PKD domain-containing protein n=1 Tax=Neptunitalea chrysea TaxID=1647581 RepID=A0A9W6B5K2_9FLAO|nr:glycerophosphodiester phosphodiesterase family protein [Neptunitalea chrysea]GLB52975.1 hypothetical protein NBRC110019_20150 [Neptunitalea chrysea]
MKTIGIKLGLLFVLCTGSWLTLTSCSKDGDADSGSQSVQPSFEASVDTIFEGEQMSFVNTINSTADVAYYWDFGDGATSIAENPSHTFDAVGNYVVTLTTTVQGTETSVAKEVGVYRHELENRPGLVTYMESLNGNIMVCAHRMYHNVLPENSMSALNASIEAGIGMVEIDIRQTKDGELVLLHDSTLDDTTTGSGDLTDYLLEELGQFYLYKADGSLSNEHIPTFKEILEVARGNIYIDIDVKMENYLKIYQLVKQYGMLSQCMFTTDELSVCQSLQNADSKTILFPIVREETDYAAYTLTGLDIRIFQLNSDMSQNQTVVDDILANGDFFFANIYINSNVTPQSNNYVQVNNFINLGGSIIQTDYPVTLKSYLQNLNLN